MTIAQGVVRLRVLGGVDLRDQAGDEIRTVLVQPKRLALLVYISVAGADRFVRRDTLTSLFWPEAQQEPARHSLRTSLHFIRQALGGRVLIRRGQEELRVDPAALWCDAISFEQALSEGRAAEGMSLYRGNFLESFFVPDGSPDLEQWFDQQRGRLKGRATECTATLVESAAEDGNAALARHWAARCLDLAPHDEGLTRRVMAALNRLGDRGQALRIYQELSARLSKDLEVRPSAETRHLAMALRVPDSTPALGSEPPTAVATASMARSIGSSELSQTVVTRLPNASRPRLAWLRIGWLIAGGLLAAVVMVALPRSDPGAAPVFAVGTIENRVPPGIDSLDPGGAVRELIATDLARVNGIQVVSEARLGEILSQLGIRKVTPAARTDAARKAGASELLEGVLYLRSPDRLRLDLRRVDLAKGVMRGSLSAEAPDLFSLADSATAALGRSFGREAPSAPLGQLVTTSLVARRFYEEGLRAYSSSDAGLALAMFRSALSQDSSFAMAAFYAAKILLLSDPGAAADFLVLARRASANLPKRDRLLIETGWAQVANDPSLVAVAESLATLYPTEPDGEYAWGMGLAWAGEPAKALGHLRRAVAMDSLSLGGRGLGCRACDALEAIVLTEMSLGDLPSAEATARSWLAQQPKSAWGWRVLADFLERTGREADAMEAGRRFSELTRNNGAAMPWLRARLAIRAGRFGEADQLLNSQMTGRDNADADVLWWRVISLRNQGRLQEALDIARRLTRAGRSAGNSTAAAAEAQVQFERGHFREAARLFEEIAAKSLEQPSAATPLGSLSSRARGGAWYLTHVADALAMAGDTVGFATRADSVERLGKMSGFGRDQRLHHYLRGLLASARGEPDEAEARFRKAMVARIGGFSRINLRLGLLLMERGRVAEAVEPLRAALQFDLEASNFYVTHRELHRQLARAFRAAGLSDSARVHEVWGTVRTKTVQ